MRRIEHTTVEILKIESLRLSLNLDLCCTPIKSHDELLNFLSTHSFEKKNIFVDFILFRITF